MPACPLSGSPSKKLNFRCEKLSGNSRVKWNLSGHSGPLLRVLSVGAFPW